MNRIIYIIISVLCFNSLQAQNNDIEPVRERVNIQMDTACTNQIIDGKWVAVGTNKEHATGYDYSLMLDGKPSFYRVGNSSVPVRYNLGGYYEEKLNMFTKN